MNERKQLGRGGEGVPAPSSAGRSRNMRAIRRSDTKPEVRLRSALHGLGYRFRKDFKVTVADAKAVRPDIVFTARKVAVFVDGCFWHCCPEHGRPPTTNEWYWGPKLARNVERDRWTDQVLAANGWTVVRLCEHVPLQSAVEAVAEALDPNI
ncbi:very short patch repair endonuclease [Nocardia thailandica]|uniref:Very short patch repair endonuclease n=1 Tax=Nocardia thailandica TaxID=257275 RepID=A0ABW6PSD4_9NOCA